MLAFLWRGFGANLETVDCPSLLGANCGRRRELQWPHRAWIPWKSSKVYLRRCRSVLKQAEIGVQGAARQLQMDRSIPYLGTCDKFTCLAWWRYCIRFPWLNIAEMAHISVTGVRFLCWIYPTDIPSVLWCRWRRTIEGSGRRNARGGALFNAVGSWWDEIPEYFQKRKTSPKGLLQFSIGWLVHIPKNDSNQWWLPELIREWERERERERDRDRQRQRQRVDSLDLP